MICNATNCKNHDYDTSSHCGIDGNCEQDEIEIGEGGQCGSFEEKSDE